MTQTEKGSHESSFENARHGSDTAGNLKSLSLGSLSNKDANINVRPVCKTKRCQNSFINYNVACK